MNPCCFVTELAESEIENIYSRNSSHPEKILIVVITSNRGLCGAFNSNVIKEVKRLYLKSTRFSSARGIYIITIGKRDMIT